MSLFPVATQIAEAALLLGGADIAWYRADFCDGLRDDGSPCFNESRGDHWIECPLCQGKGMYYKSPRLTKGIYSESQDSYDQEMSGGFTQGRGTLTLPKRLRIRILKPRANRAGRLLRDKFEILGPCCVEGRRAVERVLYLEDNTVVPYVQGQGVFQIIQVRTNHPEF